MDKQPLNEVPVVRDRLPAGVKQLLMVEAKAAIVLGATVVGDHDPVFGLFVRL